MSYNKSQGEANWVSWHLQKSDLGNIRRGSFWPDPLLPSDMQIRPNDYRGSGYDRGHVCPSGDRTATREDNNATFVMSNMLPQAAALNQHVWKDLEDYSRYLVGQGNELYCVAGGSGTAGRIAGGKVNVPALCWKIIVVLPLGDEDLKRITTDTRVIAVSIPNRERDEIQDSQWAQWITSVDQLEKTTGYDFLSALPDEIEDVLEAKRDSGRAQRSDRGTSNRGTSNRGTSNRGTSNRGTSKATSRGSTRNNASAGATFSQRNGSPDFQPLPEPRAKVHNRSIQTDQRSNQNQAAADNQVWVNTKSGVYHYPGARWYGATKQGEFMSEQQALARDYHAAQNGQ